jgi:ubiquinone/menaquinone biosynthesis C-methylase UbiE
MTVLDVGCGKGYFSLGMARMVGSSGKAVAVDLNEEKIEHLKTEAAKAGFAERIDPRIGTEHSMQIDDLTGRVDFALAFYVVHHAPAVDALMSEVYQALKPGGKFLIVEPGHHSSPKERAATESAGQRAGFVLIAHPKLVRDWAVLLAKSR